MHIYIYMKYTARHAYVYMKYMARTSWREARKRRQTSYCSFPDTISCACRFVERGVYVSMKIGGWKTQDQKGGESQVGGVCVCECGCERKEARQTIDIMSKWMERTNERTRMYIHTYNSHLHTNLERPLLVGVHRLPAPLLALALLGISGGGLRLGLGLHGVGACVYM
jgi:hypothetical protein